MPRLKFRVRRYDTNGFRSHPALQGEFVGLEEVDHGLWDVYFATSMVGRFDESTMSIRGPVRRNTSCP
ncbi:MAG: hypothetical protein ACI9MR_000341, partial [Myxococcota bacterium]